MSTGSTSSREASSSVVRPALSFGRCQLSCQTTVPLVREAERFGFSKYSSAARDVLKREKSITKPATRFSVRTCRGKEKNDL
jgi:hypothetical protein